MTPPSDAARADADAYAAKAVDLLLDLRPTSGAFRQVSDAMWDGAAFAVAAALRAEREATERRVRGQAKIDAILECADPEERGHIAALRSEVATLREQKDDYRDRMLRAIDDANEWEGKAIAEREGRDQAEREAESLKAALAAKDEQIADFFSTTACDQCGWSERTKDGRCASCDAEALGDA